MYVTIIKLLDFVLYLIHHTTDLFSFAVIFLINQIIGASLGGYVPGIDSKVYLCY